MNSRGAGNTFIEKGSQSLPQNAVAEEPSGDFIVSINHLFAKFGVFQHLSGLADGFFRDISINFYYRKSLGLDIHGVYGIGIDHNRSAKVDCLQKRIAKALKIRGIGNQIRMGINIFKSVNLPSPCPTGILKTVPLSTLLVKAHLPSFSFFR